MKKKAINIHYELYKKIALSFFVASIVLFIIIFYFSYRKAIIKITPRSEIIKTEFIADIKPATHGQNQLKGRLLQTEIEEKIEFQAEGETEESLDEIAANIVIVNESSRAQPLIQTTRFLTANGILFRLRKTVTAPANGKIEAVIYADDPLDITSAIEVGKLSIPGLNENRQKEIYGEIKNPIIADARKVKIITEKDIASAKEKALDELFKKSLVEFAHFIKTGEKILSKAISKEIINFETDKKEGEKEENFTAAIKAKFTAALFDEDELFKIAETNLAGALPKGEKLEAADKENLIYEIEKYNMETDTANLRVMLAGKSTIDKNNEIFDKEILTGMEEAAAIQYLKSFNSIKTVEIEQVPSWWNRLPKMESSIEIVITE